VANRRLHCRGGRGNNKKKSRGARGDFEGRVSGAGGGTSSLYKKKERKGGGEKIVGPHLARTGNDKRWGALPTSTTVKTALGKEIKRKTTRPPSWWT